MAFRRRRPETLYPQAFQGTYPEMPYPRGFWSAPKASRPLGKGFREEQGGKKSVKGKKVEKVPSEKPNPT